MGPLFRIFAFLVYFFFALVCEAQPYFQATAAISGNSLVFKIMPKLGNITCGWTDIEFFLRNNSGLPNANASFQAATITVNTTDFPGVSIPYNGMNVQGVETGYNNYWFGVSFSGTSPQTYLQNQEYTVCTITLGSSPTTFDLELCHNEPGFFAHYLALTDQNGQDRTNLTGTNKLYGPGAVICSPANCPSSTPGANHILPLDGSLPVELLSFQAYAEEGYTARLEWQTATEINFREFEVERLHQTSWQTIGRVPAKALAGAGATYTYYDDRAPAPVAYYRLRMVDYDASFAYSPVRSATFELKGALLIFPNPVSETLFLQFGGEWAEGNILVELADGTGRIVFSQEVAVLPGETLPLTLSAAQLAESLYLFRASTPEGFVFARPLAVLSNPR